MRTGIVVAITIGFVTFAGSSHAAKPTLPAVVTADLKTIAAECVEVGGKALTDEAIKRADLNGDGKEDYVLDVGAIQCDGAASIYGDRSKKVTVYVGDGAGGAAVAFSDMSYGIRLEGTGARTKLWLTVMGLECGKKPAVDFASEKFCERSLVWQGATKKFEFAPVSTVKMIE
jgi:hypothetical protein